MIRAFFLLFGSLVGKSQSKDIEWVNASFKQVTGNTISKHPGFFLGPRKLYNRLRRRFASRQPPGKGFRREDNQCRQPKRFTY